MSSTQAKNYHSITFGNKNTWDDWHLIPASRPEFASPKGRTIFAEIPGHPGGGIDITNINVQHPIYENRTGSFTFNAVNGYGEWYERYKTIREYLHGQHMQAILDDDPEYYYEGRFSVGPWGSGKSFSTIEIEYDVDPYKRKIQAETISKTISGETSVTVNNDQEVYAPYITASADMMLLLRGELFEIPSGRSINPLIWLDEGKNNLVFRGNGTITIEHRGGLL